MTAPPFTSNLQKGGALLDLSALLVSSWDNGLSVAENLSRAMDTNLLGASSAVRRKDLLERILKPRFIDPGPHVMSALQVLLKDDRHAFRDACYFEATRAEPLLARFIEEPAFSWYESGRSTITVGDVGEWLEGLERSGLTLDWSDAVRTRVARALLASLRDFGVLVGVASGTQKEFGQPYPSIGGFAYACWRLQEMGMTAASVESSRVWRRWLLDSTDVASLMADLAQHGVIQLNRAGSVVRIEWRAESLAEVVHAAA